MDKAKIDYLQTFLPSRYIIGGKTLEHLTIGHLMLFEKYNIDPTDTDSIIINMILTHMIVCRNWKQNRKLLYSPKLFKMLYRWTKWNLTHRYDFNKETQILMEFIKVAMTNAPTTYMDANQEKYAGPNKEKGSPALMTLIVRLLTDFDSENLKNIFNTKHPLDTPIDAITWVMSVKNEMEGLVTIDPLDDKEFDPIKSHIDKYNKMEGNPEEIFKQFMADDSLLVELRKQMEEEDKKKEKV